MERFLTHNPIKSPEQAAVETCPGRLPLRWEETLAAECLMIPISILGEIFPPNYF